MTAPVVTANNVMQFVMPDKCVCVCVCIYASASAYVCMRWPKHTILSCAQKALLASSVCTSVIHEDLTLQSLLSLFRYKELSQLPTPLDSKVSLKQVRFQLHTFYAASSSPSSRSSNPARASTASSMTTLLMLIRSTMAPCFHGQVEGKCVGVIRYSGYANRQNVQQKLGELVALLRKVCACVCVPCGGAAPVRACTDVYGLLGR